MTDIEIGVIGGSGLYALLEQTEDVKMETPYGPPSDLIAVGRVGSRKVAFLPRHGRNHQHPPHTIPYRANIWALKNLGVTRIVAPSLVGSLQTQIRPGDFVICDQFVDRTTGRKDTFYDGPGATHVSMADPYCPELRDLVIKTCSLLDLATHPLGTVVVIQGPRFSTRAESRWFRESGWQVINMTQYPEVNLAREQEICYCNVSLVTDYDVWAHEPVSAEEVTKLLRQNIDKLKGIIKTAVPEVPKSRGCACSRALQSAKI